MGLLQSYCNIDHRPSRSIKRYLLLVIFIGFIPLQQCLDYAPPGAAAWPDPSCSAAAPAHPPESPG